MQVFGTIRDLTTLGARIPSHFKLGRGHRRLRDDIATIHDLWWYRPVRADEPVQCATQGFSAIGQILKNIVTAGEGHGFNRPKNQKKLYELAAPFTAISMVGAPVWTETASSQV